MKGNILCLFFLATLFLMVYSPDARSKDVEEAPEARQVLAAT